MDARLKIHTWIDKETLEMELLIEKYGIYGLLIFYILDKIYPQWSGFFLSTRAKKMDLDLETMRAQQQIERDSREEERVFRHDIDKRNSEAFEKLVVASQQQVNLLITLAERMATLNLSQTMLTTFLTESLASMRERIASEKTK